MSYISGGGGGGAIAVPVTVPNGGTGLITITDHAVMVGSGVAAVTPVGPGNTNQVFIGNTGADPSWGTVPNAGLTNSSITLANGNNINITGSPVSLGGTATVNVSGTTQYAIQVGDATGSLDSLGIGLAGQVMQSSGAGVNPAWTTATYPATTAQGDVIYSSAANVVDSLAKSAVATRYIANTGAGNNPQWDQINLANGVTGILTVPNGGTGLSTITDHGILLGSGAGAITPLGVATDGQIPIGSTGADPVLATITAGANISVVNAAGSITIASTATGGPEFADNVFRVIDNGDNTKKLAFECSGITGATTRTITMDDRDIDMDAVATTVVSDAGNATPAAGSFSIVGAGTVSTSAAGAVVTITGAGGGGGISWSEVTGTSQTMATDAGYITNNAGLVTCTLPTTAAVGKVVRVCGKGAGGWKIAQNAGESIIWDESTSTTVGVGGSLASTDDYDSVELLCTVADTTWTVLSSKGNVTVV